MMTMEESSGVGACKLIRMLKEDEHPDLTKKEENELADEEKRELRFFNPVLKTSPGRTPSIPSPSHSISIKGMYFLSEEVIKTEQGSYFHRDVVTGRGEGGQYAT